MMNLCESPSPGVLVIAYRRHENIRNILEKCVASGITRIYITVDSPRNNTIEEELDVRKVKEVVRDFKSRNISNVKVESRASLRNLGCAVSVLSGCDWAFTFETNLIVIEDDCVPSKLFFDFFRMYKNEIDMNQQVLFICGTQLAPSLLTGDLGFLSKYPLTWGWGTNQETWRIIRKIFDDEKLWRVILDDLIALTPEQAYWRAAKRRALFGITDVWDSVVVQFMAKENLLAILPPRNLVLNNGSDSVATNVPSNSEWTNRSVSTDLKLEKEKLFRRPEVENWIRNKCYGIGLKHIFSTKITLILDLLHLRPRKFNKYLKNRILDLDYFEVI